MSHSESLVNYHSDILHDFHFVIASAVYFILLFTLENEMHRYFGMSKQYRLEYVLKMCDMFLQLKWRNM